MISRSITLESMRFDFEFDTCERCDEPNLFLLKFLVSIDLMTTVFINSLDGSSLPLFDCIG